MWFPPNATADWLDKPQQQVAWRALYPALAEISDVLKDTDRRRDADLSLIRSTLPRLADRWQEVITRLRQQNSAGFQSVRGRRLIARRACVRRLYAARQGDWTCGEPDFCPRCWCQRRAWPLYEALFRAADAHGGNLIAVHRRLESRDWPRSAAELRTAIQSLTDGLRAYLADFESSGRRRSQILGRWTCWYLSPYRLADRPLQLMICSRVLLILGPNAAETLSFPLSYSLGGQQWLQCKPSWNNPAIWRSLVSEVAAYPEALLLFPSQTADLWLELAHGSSSLPPHVKASGVLRRK